MASNNIACRLFARAFERFKNLFNLLRLAATSANTRGKIRAGCLACVTTAGLSSSLITATLLGQSHRCWLFIEQA